MFSLNDLGVTGLIVDQPSIFGTKKCVITLDGVRTEPAPGIIRVELTIPLASHESFNYDPLKRYRVIVVEE